MSRRLEEEILKVGEEPSMKHYRVTATFPELPAAHAVQEARGEATSLSVGVKRALDSILRGPHVKGRRISAVKLYVRLEEPQQNLP
jgi:predicted thioesterase